jgi:hypothetical protein
MKMPKVSDYAGILTKLQQIAPAAHIAGGAVRDTVLQRDIADIDIFLADEHLEDAVVMLRCECGYVKVGEWKQYLEFSDPAMTRVAKFEKADETIPICIIGLLAEYARPNANVSRFDFGICMSWFDGKRIACTLAFSEDSSNKTFTLCRADNLAQFFYSMSRFEKLTGERYRGWSLTIPEKFRELAKEYAFRKNWYLDKDNLLRSKGLGGGNLLPPKTRDVSISSAGTRE